MSFFAENITLQPVDQQNFDDCCNLKREGHLYVGSAEAVLAEAYLFRQHSTAYAICQEDIVIGLVIIMDQPQGDHYSFTNLFIADDFQGKGYGTLAVKAILDKFKEEKKCNVVEIQVHTSNIVAKKIYTGLGFVKTKNADWNQEFEVMQLRI